jgi:hypothetical protein
MGKLGNAQKRRHHGDKRLNLSFAADYTRVL